MNANTLKMVKPKVNENLLQEKIIISDQALEEAFGYSDYSPFQKRELLRQSVLKSASGFYPINEVNSLLTALDLIDGKGDLSKKGCAYLFASFNKDNKTI